MLIYVSTFAQANNNGCIYGRIINQATKQPLMGANVMLPDQHNLNIRIDYRRQFNYLALVTYLDILNVYGHLNVVEERFLERTGKYEEKGFEMMSAFRLRIEF
jgi:hypothetical protein